MDAVANQMCDQSDSKYNLVTHLRSDHSQCSLTSMIEFRARTLWTTTDPEDDRQKYSLNETIKKVN